MYSLLIVLTIHNFFEIIIEHWQIIKEFNDPWPCEQGHDNNSSNFSVHSLSTSSSKISSKQFKQDLLSWTGIKVAIFTQIRKGWFSLFMGYS